MINFDSLTLKALMEEIEPFLIDARIQKIRQPSRRELILTLRKNSHNHNLFISIKPSFAHICLMEEENRKFRILEIPQSPPMFCMLLRKYMENSKLEHVIIPKHERIVEFYFTAYGDLGERIKLVLAIELMGKHSNMILYNADSKIILGCAHNVGEEKSKNRELAGNLPYIYPPKYHKIDITQINEIEFINLAKVIRTTFHNWLNEEFYDISIPLAKEICQKFNISTSKDLNFVIDVKILKEVFAELQSILSLNTIKPSISEDFGEFSITGKYKHHLKTINEMVDLYFAKNSFAEILERKRRNLVNIIEKEEKKIKRLTKKLLLGKDLEEKIILYKHIADTLMANIYSFCETNNKVKLKNVYTNEEMIIEIDRTKSLNDNAQNYYKLYNKAKKAKENNENLHVKYIQKEKYLQSIKSAIKLAIDIETLQEIEEEISEMILLNNNKKRQKRKEKIVVEKQEDANSQIFIGKNNKQNDYIVSKIASPEDFWFHVRGDFGSHVLVKLKNKKEDIPEEILLKAAKLAAKYSERKNDAKINVIYTKRKYLKKPPGANLGYVTYKNEKELTITLGDENI